MQRGGYNQMKSHMRLGKGQGGHNFFLGGGVVAFLSFAYELALLLYVPGL